MFVLQYLGVVVLYWSQYDAGIAMLAKLSLRAKEWFG